MTTSRLRFCFLCSLLRVEEFFSLATVQQLVA